VCARGARSRVLSGGWIGGCGSGVKWLRLAAADEGRENEGRQAKKCTSHHNTTPLKHNTNDTKPPAASRAS
jgi:hypothetical protein